MRRRRKAGTQALDVLSNFETLLERDYWVGRQVVAWKESVCRGLSVGDQQTGHGEYAKHQSSEHDDIDDAKRVAVLIVDGAKGSSNPACPIGVCLKTSALHGSRISTKCAT